jgi:hypothetical protein
MSYKFTKKNWIIAQDREMKNIFPDTLNVEN